MVPRRIKGPLAPFYLDVDEQASTIDYIHLELRPNDDFRPAFGPSHEVSRYIGGLLHRIGVPAYLLAVSSADAPSRVRSYKGIWGHGVQDGELRGLPGVRFEIGCSEGDTRLASLVVSDERHATIADELVMGSTTSMILLSCRQGIEELAKVARNWISLTEESPHHVEDEMVMLSIVDRSIDAVIRYFPADNRRSESLLIVGDRQFLALRVNGCL